jgi:Tol biopolymer transport system component
VVAKESEDIKNKDYINYISFSHDGKKILFDRQMGKGPYQIQVYDLTTHELSAYQPPENERWTMARYSFDGKHIVMSIIPREGNHSNLGDMQIAVMDPGGKNVRKITKSYGPKIYPTFSHSGDKIIYAKAASVREKGRTPAADYDIYEVDIKSGSETRLTWFNIFSFLSPPFEFPDGKTIIFSAYGVPGLPSDLENKENTYMVKKGDRKPPMPLVHIGGNNPLINASSGSRNPSISRDGNHIYFQGHAQRPDGIHGEGDQYYEYSNKGIYSRLTNLNHTSIWSGALSPDGQYIAVVFHPVFDESDSNKIAICNIKDGTNRTLNLPEKPLHFINQ